MQAERDQMFMLAVYSLIHRHWQGAEVPWQERRGYNIGALLVDSEGRIVYHALNAVNECNDSTQHAEVRLIQGFIETTGRRDIASYRIYTSLEPCVMCAGMMIMTRAESVVFGQRDYDYSGALERLSLDSRELGGYQPYPRSIPAIQCEDSVSRTLDEAYADFRKRQPGEPLARFLGSAAAERIMSLAWPQLGNYEPTYEPNRLVLESICQYMAELDAESLKRATTHDPQNEHAN